MKQVSLNQQATQTTVPKVKYPLYDILLKKEWSYETGAVLLAAFGLALAIVTGGAWGVTGPLHLWGAKFLSLFGVNVGAIAAFSGVAEFSFWRSMASMTNLGLVVGALVAVLLAAQFKLKGINNWRNVAAAVLGGLLMGVGARFADGCNIGALFSALPAFSLQGWAFMGAMFFGAPVGSVLLKKYFMSASVVKKPRKSVAVKLSPEQRKRKRIIQIIIGLILLVAYIALAVYAQEINPNAAFILMIGLAFGYVLQRSRFCFTACFRDPYLTGTTNLTKAVILTLVLSSVVFAALQMQATGFNLENLIIEDLAGNVRPVGIVTLLGGFIFAIGAVIAGGCASGTFVRMGEGFMQLWITIVFFIIGSMIGAIAMIPVRETFLFSPEPIYLPQALGGWIPALIFQFGILIVVYFIADWYGKKKTGALQ